MLYLKVVLIVSNSQYAWVKNADVPFRELRMHRFLRTSRKYYDILCPMEKTRPILYGVADYAEIRKANAWFGDRIAKIRDLAATRYAVFPRPRRFGKSLLRSILEAYYDVAHADRFEQLFARRGSHGGDCVLSEEV